MRKIIFSMPVSLDGYVEGPNGLDWVIADDDLHNYYATLLREADLMFYGRVTYEMMLAYWPTAPADPSLSKSELDFADQINRISKIVYSSTLKNVAWNTRLEASVVPEEIMKLKEQRGKDLLLGGGPGLASTFINQGLVDEYRLLVHPVVLGAGKPLFKGIAARIDLQLTGSKEYPSGVVELRYQPRPGSAPA